MESPAVAMAVVQARLRLARDIPMALGTLEHLAEHAVSEKVRLEAAVKLLDRAGIVPPAPPKEDPNMPEKPLHELSTEELRALAARLEDEIAGRARPIAPCAGSGVVHQIEGELAGRPKADPLAALIGCGEVVG